MEGACRMIRAEYEILIEIPRSARLFGRYKSKFLYKNRVLDCGLDSPDSGKSQYGGPL
jgi:hypothetical protein